MAPCGSWITDPDDLCDSTGAFTEEQREAIVAEWGPIATMVLWSLTRRLYPGACTDMVWPGRDAGSCVQWVAYPTGGSRPLVADGAAIPAGWCGLWHDRLVLPLTPVRKIVEVVVDGVVVPPEEYVLQNRRELVRCSGSWPHWSSPCDDFTVTYEHGRRPPAGGAKMAGQLALEFAKGCAPGQDCRLPSALQGISSVQQEGVSQTFVVTDAVALLQAGLTNVPAVDLWVAAVNGNNRPGKVLGAAMLGQNRRIAR